MRTALKYATLGMITLFAIGCKAPKTKTDERMERINELELILNKPLTGMDYTDDRKLEDLKGVREEYNTLTSSDNNYNIIKQRREEKAADKRFIKGFLSGMATIILSYLSLNAYFCRNKKKNQNNFS